MTEKIWYVGSKGRQKGPYSTAAVRKAAAAGKLRPGTRVWKEGMSDWLPLAAVDALADALPEDSAEELPPALPVLRPEAGGYGPPRPTGTSPKKSGGGKLLAFGCLGLMLLSCCVLSLPKIVFTLFPEMQAELEEKKRADRKAALEALARVSALPAVDFELPERPLPARFRTGSPTVLHVDAALLERIAGGDFEGLDDLPWWCRDRCFTDLAEDLEKDHGPLAWSNGAGTIARADLLAVFHPSFFEWPREGEGDTFYSGYCAGVVRYIEVSSGEVVGQADIYVESSDIVSGGSGIRVYGVPIQTSSFADELYQDFASNIEDALEEASARLRG